MHSVLVVEDNEDNMAVVESYLEDDFILFEADNGLEGLALMREKRPDIVLLDISLPEMDGMEVLKRTREDNEINDIPIIAVTAHAMVGDKEKFLKCGFNGYVSKPIVDDEMLIKTINSHIRKDKK